MGSILCIPLSLNSPHLAYWMSCLPPPRGSLCSRGLWWCNHPMGDGLQADHWEADKAPKPVVTLKQQQQQQCHIGSAFWVIFFHQCVKVGGFNYMSSREIPTSYFQHENRTHSSYTPPHLRISWRYMGQKMCTLIIFEQHEEFLNWWMQTIRHNKPCASL